MSDPRAGTACGEPGCGGTVLDDGYCDTCGAKAKPPGPSRSSAPGGAGGPAPSASRSFATGSRRAGGSRRLASARTASARSRSSLGSGLVDVPPAPLIDPTGLIMADPQVKEDKRFCSRCGSAVGRSQGGKAGRSRGFCPSCRNPYDFLPKLQPGELLAGQYEVAGCLAHGGLGWIYLVRDRAVHGRWSVLKGLLDSGDEAAMAVAVSERRFLAQIDHPSIVQIYNFVTHKGAGYIVMEYVGGPSLKQLLKRRQEANGGQPDPLPPEQAIAFVLAILPAFAYLHGRGMVYCDFKPDNLIQVEDQVKLIDLGGVRHIDDPVGDIYGTVGFQAPEIAEMGPSVASDIYTMGRTLAVLTMDFRGYQGTFAHSLPDPADHPVLARFPSFHRFLLKSTAEHPDDRFQSVTEAGDQLMGVLREVMALTTGLPHPGPSANFGAPRGDEGLPPLTVAPGDQSAGFLTSLPADPAEVVRAIAEGVTAGQLEETGEVRLRRARALLELGERDAALAEVAAVEAADPWEWRAVWLRGVAALSAGDVAGAAAAFERCMFEVPGELAPKLAAGVCAERAGDLSTAAALYGAVSAVDPAYVAATTGLARCRLAQDDLDGALKAWSRVPPTHRAYGDARVSAVRALVANGRFAEAADTLEGLRLEPRPRAELDVLVFETALSGPATGRARPDPRVRVRGHALDEDGARRGLEEACRALARLTSDPAERVRLVDRANEVRPFSVV
ncbi:MAG: tetratricopeptide repeat protein [Actinomycetota bacterium]